MSNIITRIQIAIHVSASRLWGEDIYEWHQSGRSRMRCLSADHKRWIYRDMTAHEHEDDAWDQAIK
jgi:hypothetical protein